MLGSKTPAGASPGGVILTAPRAWGGAGSPGAGFPPGSLQTVQHLPAHPATAKGSPAPRQLTLQPGSQLWAASQVPAAARRAPAAPVPSRDQPPCDRGRRQPRFPLPRCLVAPWHAKCSVWNFIFPLNALEEKERD